MKKNLKILISALFLLISPGTLTHANQLPTGDSVILDEIKTALEANYLYPEKLPLTGSTSISGYLSTLQDPYTQYYNPQEAKRLTEILDNTVSGIGIVLDRNSQGYPEIQAVIKNSPAANAGLQTGDLILAVDGSGFQKSQDFNLFISKIRGKTGSSTSLFIFRAGKIFTLDITRELIPIPILSSKKINEKCYLALNNFDKGSADAFLQAMKNLGKCEEMIFDLRDNPGGIIDEVLKMLESFLPQDLALLTLETKNHQQIEYAKSSNLALHLPKTTIIINQGSASASEIFAGTLKYYFPQKVRIIGETSYGKGSMQEVLPLSNSGLLKYTIALRHIANTNISFEKIGISPEIKIVDDPKTPQDEVLLSLGINE